MCKGHYSPKIKKEYIFFLYHVARYLEIPMTQLVNEIIGAVVMSLNNREITRAFEAMIVEDKEFEEITTFLESLIRSKNRRTRRKLIRLFKQAKKRRYH